MNIGKRLRTLRSKKKMSLKELSKESKVAMSTLSRIEHGIMTGTLESHMQICKALDISLAEFYKGLETGATNVTLLKANDKRDTFVYAQKSSLEFLTTKVMDKKMMPIMLRIAPNSQTHSEENKVGSEKFLYIFTGNITVQIGKDEYKLNKGASLYFNASAPHYFKNESSAEALLMCVSTPPEF